MVLENIPTYLKQNARWCGWRYVLRDGKKSKIPKILDKKNSNASTSKPETFLDFDTAKENYGSFDGLGILLQNRMVGIDLDHCIENGTIQIQAKEIISHFPKSYVEKSPSGTGLRIFVLMPEDFDYSTDRYKQRKDGLEIYVAGYTKRYMSVTGDMIQAGDVVEDAAGLQWILDTFLSKEKKKQKDCVLPDPGISLMSDDQLFYIATHAKNSEKFTRLWNGDRSMHLKDEDPSDPDYSVSDMALVEMLLFYSNGDMEQTDRLFRQSGLYREKWDEKRGDGTYGSLTIQETLKKMDTFFKPDLRNPELEFNDELQRLKTYKPDDYAVYPYSELGAGKLFANFYKESMRYIPERKSWFYYEDGIWQQDLGNCRVEMACMNLARLLYLYLNNEYEGNQKAKFGDYVKRWDKHQFRSNVIKDAKSYFPFSYKKFDSDMMLINCLNGTLHLDTGEFTEHTYSDFLTMKAEVNYDPDQKDERWPQFIDEIMEGDQEKAEFLQKIFGYCLSGTTEYECFFILLGSTTRNGKGTLCESILNLIGNYGTASAPEVLETKWHSNSSAPNEDIARLAGKRFVSMAEPRKSLRLNAALTKSLTGNDTISARFLNENSFTFKPQFKIVINTNHQPSISDTTIFQSGRVYVVPFEHHFPEEDRDLYLKQYFSQPEVRSSIFNWMLEGYRKLQKEGLKPPASVKDAVSRFFKDSDKIGLFLEEETEQQEDFEERSSKLYKAYQDWCKANGYQYENSKHFKDRVNEDFEIIRKRPKAVQSGNKTTMVLGLRLNDYYLDFLN